MKYVYCFIIILIENLLITHSDANECTKGTYFDHGSGKCRTFPGGGIALYVDHSIRCSNNFIGVKPHPTQLQYYVVCKDDSIVLGKCNGLSVFNKKLNKCTRIDDISAEGNVNPFLKCTQPGRYPLKPNCAMYYVCKNDGKPKIYRCTGHKRFDPESGKCSYNTKCSPVSISFTTAPKSTTEQPMSKIRDYDSSYPPCRRPGRFRTPNNCALYYSCSAKSNGKFYQTRYKCSSGFFYDMEQEKCVPKETVRCTKKTEHEILALYERIQREKLNENSDEFIDADYDYYPSIEENEYPTSEEFDSNESSTKIPLTTIFDNTTDNIGSIHADQRTTTEQISTEPTSETSTMTTVYGDKETTNTNWKNCTSLSETTTSPTETTEESFSTDVTTATEGNISTYSSTSLISTSSVDPTDTFTITDTSTRNYSEITSCSSTEGYTLSTLQVTDYISTTDQTSCEDCVTTTEPTSEEKSTALGQTTSELVDFSTTAVDTWSNTVSSLSTDSEITPETITSSNIDSSDNYESSTDPIITTTESFITDYNEFTSTIGNDLLSTTEESSSILTTTMPPTDESSTVTDMTTSDTEYPINTDDDYEITDAVTTSVSDEDENTTKTSELLPDTTTEKTTVAGSYNPTTCSTEIIDNRCECCRSNEIIANDKQIKLNIRKPVKIIINFDPESGENCKCQCNQSEIPINSDEKIRIITRKESPKSRNNSAGDESADKSLEEKMLGKDFLIERFNKTKRAI